jgi:hypothetical protein
MLTVSFTKHKEFGTSAPGSLFSINLKNYNKNEKNIFYRTPICICN